jgi:HTH-type transcriptional regulator / antitoxin HipB
MQNINDIGAIIPFHRKKSGLSQRGLADMAGVGKTAVFDLEKGKITVRMDTLMKICRVLNVRLLLDSPLMEQWTLANKTDSPKQKDPEP